MTKPITLEEAFKKGCIGEFYLSTHGWSVHMSGECAGTLLDHHRNVAMWTGHYGDKLDPLRYPLLSLVTRAEYLFS